MPTSVYSVRFAALDSTSSDTTLTVPDGKVWILRDLDLVVVSGSSPVFALRGSAGQDIWIVTETSLGSNLWAGWRGRQILTAGESCHLSPAAGTFDVTLSGYELLS